MVMKIDEWAPYGKCIHVAKFDGLLIDGLEVMLEIC